MQLNQWQWGAVVPVILFTAILWWTNHWAVAFLGLVAIALGTVIVQKNWEKEAFYWTAILLPWSVKIDIGIAEVMLPGEWLISILAIVVAGDFIRNKSWRVLQKHPLPLLWVTSFILPIALSTMLFVSVKFALINTVFVLVFYYGSTRFGREEVLRWMNGYFASFVLVALWGVYQFYVYEFNPITITGIFQPFYYSSTLVGAIAALFTGYFIGQVHNHRANFIFAILAVLVVVFSESRAALLSVVLMFLVWALLQLPKKARVMLPIIALLAGVVFGGDRIREAFTYNQVESHDPSANVFEETLSVTNVQTDVSNVERLNRWVSALKMFKDKPHVGFGPGTYQFQYIPFQEASLKNRLSVRNPDDVPQGSGGSAHSELLLQLSENGWPTTLLFIVMLILWMRKGLWAEGQVLRQRAPFFLGLMTYFFHMNVNNFLNQPEFAFLFWIFGAMLMMPENE